MGTFVSFYEEKDDYENYINSVELEGHTIKYLGEESPKSMPSINYAEIDNNTIVMNYDNSNVPLLKDLFNEFEKAKDDVIILDTKTIPEYLVANIVSYYCSSQFPFVLYIPVFTFTKMYRSYDIIYHFIDKSGKLERIENKVTDLPAIEAVKLIEIIPVNHY